MPEIIVAHKTFDISVEIETIQNGLSPFRTKILPSFVNASATTTVDFPGIMDYQGLSNGVYKANSHFFIQARDTFSNNLLDGPLNEIQAIEIDAQEGEFVIHLFGKSVRLPFKAGIADVQKEVQKIHGVGFVAVTANSAKSLVPGVTVSATHGHDIITPSSKLTSVSVGDWLRIGNQMAHNSQLLT